MSKGLSGLFSGTRGEYAAGSANFMDPQHNFLRFISKRKDVDANGFYDVIGHGTPDSILVFHNGKEIEVSHRVLSRLLRQDPGYKGGPVRLLSCSTGSNAGKFAQDLANKLGVPVKAPTELLWAFGDGTYRVAKGLNGTNQLPDLSQKGRFKTFYPKKGKKQ